MSATVLSNTPPQIKQFMSPPAGAPTSRGPSELVLLFRWLAGIKPLSCDLLAVMVYSQAVMASSTKHSGAL